MIHHRYVRRNKVSRGGKVSLAFAFITLASVVFAIVQLMGCGATAGSTPTERLIYLVRADISAREIALRSDGEKCQPHPVEPIPNTATQAQILCAYSTYLDYLECLLKCPDSDKKCCLGCFYVYRANHWACFGQNPPAPSR